MKTKIVYDLISSDSDIYMEQMLVSVFSLKHFTPDACVVAVVDESTCNRVKQWHLLYEYINELIPVDFDETIPNKERSRWIKTNLRNIVEGDFLFLDTDTVVAGDLTGIDDIDAEIAMVPDLHCRTIGKHPFQKNICRRIKDLFGHEFRSESTYFNSGVILCRETGQVHDFFEEWHKLWQEGKHKRSGLLDQRSLAVVCERTGIVKELPGDYNCQIMGSIEYLHTARIVHFFNAKWTDSPKTLSPFFDKDFYAQLKHADSIPEAIQEMILHCKSWFTSPSMVVDKGDMIIWRTSLFTFIRKIYKTHKKMFSVLNVLSQSLLFIERKINRGGVEFKVRIDAVPDVRLQFITQIVT